MGAEISRMRREGFIIFSERIEKSEGDIDKAHSRKVG